MNSYVFINEIVLYVVGTSNGNGHITLSVYWPNNLHHAVNVDEHRDTVQDIIDRTVAMVPATQTPNTQYYALRLQNMITGETLWMNKTTKIHKLLEQIWNSTCPNLECPQQQQHKCRPPNSGNSSVEKENDLKSTKVTSNISNVNDKLSVWRPELRIRYLPNSIRELYKEDKITCYFYFDQVQILSSFTL